ncbi:MAG: DUF559 domain-containing protein [Geodermatophilaceae bacterium]
MLDFDPGERIGVPERLRSQVFRGSDAVAEGLISASRLRREYTRVLHGFYVPPGVRIDHGVRTLAALLDLPDRAVLTAHSAAWWYGLEYAEATDPVVAILPPEVAVKGPKGVRVHNTGLDESDIRVVGGLRLASPLRTAWDAAALTLPRSALATVEGLIRRNVTTQAELLAELLTRAGSWGVTRARAIFELADGLSESPAESWTRWLLHGEAIPPPMQQFQVFDELGRFVARVDFAWPESKVALEYDGAYHAEPRQQAADQRRDVALAALGWTVIHMSSSDLHDPSRVLRELRARLA